MSNGTGKPKWKEKDAVRRGSEAHHLASAYRSVLEPRLGAGTIDGLGADLERLSASRPDRLATKTEQKGRTGLERYLAEEHVGRPVVVMNYPKEIKAFYMRLNDDERTVAAMDVLAPGTGEIIGGSQREERLSVLDARLEEWRAGRLASQGSR